jgi:hypothetical protein
MTSYETSIFETFDTKSLLLFYILLSANFLDELFSRNITYFIKNSWIIKNILAIIVLYVFVVLTNEKINDYNFIFQLLLVLAIYSWFYITRYINFTFLAIIFLLLFWILIITNRINKKKDDEPIIFDFHLSIEKMRNIKNFVFYLALFLTIWGVICYIGEYKCLYHDFNFKKIFITKHGYQVKPKLYNINDIFKYSKNAFL